LSLSQDNEITDKELAEVMCKLISEGEYKKIDVEIRKNQEIYDLIVETRLNPEIKKINVYPQSIENFQVDLSKLLTSRFRSVSVNDSCFVLTIDGRIYFSDKSALEIMRDVLKIFRSAGYPFVKMKNFYFDESSGELNIYLLDGYVSRVKISGNHKTMDFVILRDLMFKPGDILTERKIIETMKNLWGTNLFSQIKFEYQINDSVEVTLDLRESASQFLRFGVRVDNERGVQIFSDFRNENTFGLNDDFGITFQGGMRNSLLKFEYKVDRLLRTMLTYGLNVYHSERKVYTYRTYFGDKNFYLKNEGEIKFVSFGFGLSIGGQFERLGNTLLKYQIERAAVENVSRAEFKAEKNLLSKFQLNITVDSRDKAYFPNHGVYLNAFYETSQKFLGSDISYSKISFAYENYNTYFKYGTLKFKFLFGLCDESTPLSQQFFLGSVTGLNSFSGMREDEIYGRQIILGGVEVRFRNPVKIVFDNFISFRYDIGSVWEKFEAIRWKDLRQGFGFELGFDTPIGALRIVVGKSFIFKTLKQEILFWGPTVVRFSVGFE
jgi:outer membrane protein assembly factor BamA